MESIEAHQQIIFIIGISKKCICDRLDDSIRELLDSDLF